MSSKKHQKVEHIDANWQKVLDAYKADGGAAGGATWKGVGVSGRIPKVVQKAKEDIDKRAALALSKRPFFGPRSSQNESTQSSQNQVQQQDKPQPNPRPRNSQQPSTSKSRIQTTKVPASLEELLGVMKAKPGAGPGAKEGCSHLFRARSPEDILASAGIFSIGELLMDTSILAWAPSGGRCPKCNGAAKSNMKALSKTKIVFSLPWPYRVISGRMQCSNQNCKKIWEAHSSQYVSTLPYTQQMSLPVLCGKGKAIDVQLIHLLRDGMTISKLESYLHSEIKREYLRRKEMFMKRWETAMDFQFWPPGTKPDKIPDFPELPRAFLPSAPFIRGMFLLDYHINKVYLRRELKSVLSSSTIAMDHQRKIAKKIIEAHEGQVLSVVGDRNLLLGVYVVPTTAMVYAKPAMEEIGNRHADAGTPTPGIVFVDTDCCGRNKPSTQFLDDIFGSVRLDVFHVMLRLSRSINSEHPRHGQFMKYMSEAMMLRNQEDFKALLAARASLGKDGKPTRVEVNRHVRRVVPPPSTLEESMCRVVKEFTRLDEESLQSWRTEEAALGKEVSNPPIGSRGWPLLSDQFYATFSNQLKHVKNGCLSDKEGEEPLFVKTNEICYSNSTIKLPVFQSLRGTSRVEAVHSVFDREWYDVTRMGADLYDARLSWLVHRYNRKAQQRAGLDVPDPGLTPRDVEHLIATNVCQFKDFKLPSRSNDNDLPKIGMEYLVSLDDPEGLAPQIYAQVEKDKEDIIDMNNDDDDVDDDDNISMEPSLQDQLEEHRQQIDQEVAGVLTADEGFADEEEQIEEVELEGTSPSKSPEPWEIERPPPQRRFLRLKGMSNNSPQCWPVDHEKDGPMLKVWRQLYSIKGPNSQFKSLLQQYSIIQQEEMDKALQEGRRPLPYHNVSLMQAKRWVNEQIKRSTSAVSSGSITVQSMQRMTQMEKALRDVSERPVLQRMLTHSGDQHSLPQPPQEAQPFPAEVTAEDIQQERQARAIASAIARNQPGPSQPGPSQPGPNQRRVNSSYNCQYCKKPLLVGHNDHVADGSRNGCCPMKPTGPNPTEERLQQRKTKAISNSVHFSKPSKSLRGRSCGVCGFPLKGVYARNGVSFEHAQYRNHSGDGRPNQFTWCPLADDVKDKEALDKAKEQRKRAMWQRANAKRSEKRKLEMPQPGD